MHTLRFTPVKSVTAAHSTTRQDCLEHESHTFIVALGAFFRRYYCGICGLPSASAFLELRPALCYPYSRGV